MFALAYVRYNPLETLGRDRNEPNIYSNIFTTPNINTSFFATGQNFPSWHQKAFPVNLLETDKPKLQQIKKQNMSRSSSMSCPQYFRISIQEPKKVYQLCDTINLKIEARDCQKESKNTGGDYIWTWITSPSLSASQSTEDGIVDFNNGTYLARFVLRWRGEVVPNVTFLRTREELNFFKEWWHKVPFRFCYIGVFENKTHNISVPCQETPWMKLDDTKFKPKNARYLCNYTDSSTGIPWFCVRPQYMSCQNYRYHYGYTVREKVISRTDDYIINTKPHSIKHNIKFDVNGNQLFSKCLSRSKLPKCNQLLVKTDEVQSLPLVTGFYYRNKWYSLFCKKQTFNSNEMVQILRNKRLYFYGDSTLRQWYDYLYSTIGTSIVGDAIGGFAKQSFDQKNNITMTFSFHGFPIRGRLINVEIFDYIANRLDAVIGGDDAIIVLTIWAHFTVTNLDFYRQRIETIKRSIVRLLVRYPNTKIFIKSANTREEDAVSMSNWYAYQLDQLMRETMSNLSSSSVILIDAWDMTMGHNCKFSIHPVNNVIRNEIDLFLSYL